MTKFEKNIQSTKSFINHSLKNLDLFAVYARREIGSVFLLLPLDMKAKYEAAILAEPKLELHVYLLNWLSEQGFHSSSRKEVVFSTSKDLEMIENCYRVF